MCYKGARHHQHTSNVPESLRPACVLYGKMISFKLPQSASPRNPRHMVICTANPCVHVDATHDQSITRGRQGPRASFCVERVVPDSRIEDVTNNGLFVFLLAISQNMAYLTVEHIALPPFRQWGSSDGRRGRCMLWWTRCLGCES